MEEQESKWIKQEDKREPTDKWTKYGYPERRNRKRPS